MRGSTDISARMGRMLRGVLLAASALASLAQADVTPTEAPVVRFGVLRPLPGHDNLTYQPGETNVFDETLAYLKTALPEWRMEVEYFSPDQLARAVKDRAVSFALMSAGQYVEIMPLGVHPLASLTTARYPDPNRVSGALFVAAADRKDLADLQDMKGLRAVYNFKGNFINYQIPRATLAEAGFDPDAFFSKEIFTDNHPRKVLELLLDKKADIGVFRVCELESLMAREPALMGRFRAVAPTGAADEVCARSTPLYPGWTMTVTAGVDPAWSSALTKALLMMPPSEQGGVGWSIATEFDRVNEVFRLIKEGPYAYLRDWTLRRVFHEYGVLITALLLGLVFWIWHWLNVERLAQERARHLSDAYLKLEATAEAAARAETRLAALSRIGILNGLSGIFAHEMGQPLSAIGYRVQAMKSLLRRPEPDRAKIEENLRAVEALNERAGRILSKVRDYAKGRASRRAPVRLDVVLETVLKTMGKKHAIPVQVLKNTPVTVIGDELELDFALRNVLRNAFEAAGAAEGGPSPVQVSLVVKGDEARAEVVNDGAMVDAAALEAHLSPVGSRKKDGLGLGILLVRSILEAHGGKARFEPRAEGGLLAVLTLPAVRDSARCGDCRAV